MYRTDICALLCMRLKRPKHEIFGSRVFTLIRTALVGDLGTKPKIQNFDVLGLKIAILYFKILSPTSLKKFADKK
jgi:hypothetical protein